MAEKDLIDMLFKVGNQLRVEYNDFTGRITAFEAFVKLYKENELRLTLKIKEIPVEFKLNTKLYLLFQENSNHYFFSVKILEIYPGPQPQIKVTQPEVADISDLRRFFRCEVHLPLTISSKGNQATGWIKNLSASGLLAIVKNIPLKIDNIIDCEFQIPSINIPILVKSLVVRLEPAPENKQLIAINFFDISEKMQNEIIRYLFQRQREILQKTVR